MATKTITDLDAIAALADADLIAVVDDVAGTATTKKSTWTTIKAFLKTYFDGLYPTILSTERILGSGTVNLKAGDAKSIVYTVPTGKSAIVTKVVISNPTATLADGVDFDLGDGAGADTWKQTIDLSSLTATTDCIVIAPPTAKFTVFDAADEFGIIPATGATADADATMYVIGIEF